MHEPLPPGRPPLSTFEVVPYRPEGGFTAFGSLLLIVASLAAGLVLGTLGGIISRWFWLVLIFPAVIGAGVGGVGYWAIRIGHVRSTILGVASGLLGGLFAIISMYYMQYRDFESSNSIPPDVRQQLRELARLTPAEVEANPLIPPEVKQALRDPASRAGFAVHDLPSYMHFQAVLGVRISSSSDVGRKDGGMNLGYIGSWIYWALEVLIVAGIAVAMQYVAAKQPYCSECQRWKKARQLGTAPESQIEPLKQGDLPVFAEPLPLQVGEREVLVTANICPLGDDRCPVDVLIQRLVQTKEGFQQVEIAHVTYAGEALPELEEVFARRKLPPTKEPLAERAGSAIEQAIRNPSSGIKSQETGVGDWNRRADGTENG